MKSIVIIFSLILILYCTNLFSQDTLYITKNLIFTNNFTGIFDNDEIKSIDKEDFNFDGYLIIKIDSLSKIISDVSYQTSVFWVNSLADIYDYSKYYWHFEYVGTILKLAKSYMSHMNLTNDITRNNIYSFIKHYLLFNENNPGCQNFLYKDSTSLNTDMLSNNLKLWNGLNKEKAAYIIYRASFITAVLKLRLAVIISEKLQIDNVRIFVPITPLNKFEPITKETAAENGFSEDKSLKILLK